MAPFLKFVPFHRSQSWFSVKLSMCMSAIPEKYVTWSNLSPPPPPPPPIEIVHAFPSPKIEKTFASPSLQIKSNLPSPK